MSESITPIDPSQPNSAFLVTKEQYDDLQNKINSHGISINTVKLIIGGVLLTCVLTMVSFVVDAWRFHAEAYEKFTQTLSQQQAQEALVTNRFNEFELKIQKMQFENKLELQKIELERQKIKTAKVTH